MQRNDSHLGYGVACTVLSVGRFSSVSIDERMCVCMLMWLWLLVFAATSFSSLSPALVPAAGGSSITLSGSGVMSSSSINVRLTVKRVSPAGTPSSAAAATFVMVVHADYVDANTVTFSSPRLDVGGELVPPGRYRATVEVAVDGTTYEETPLTLEFYGAWRILVPGRADCVAGCACHGVREWRWL